jgi:hypothetical protein
MEYKSLKHFQKVFSSFCNLFERSLYTTADKEYKSIKVLQSKATGKREKQRTG